MRKPTSDEIVHDLELWQQYVAPQEMDNQTWNNTTPDERMKLMRELWPDEREADEDYG